ncbi:MAG: hypothetical protein KDI37_01065, partial [Xanthomonadales bacterium]|nr:hypothetical protein [Xanthomonadales bacterium]
MSVQSLVPVAAIGQIDLQSGLGERDCGDRQAWPIAYAQPTTAWLYSRLTMATGSLAPMRFLLLIGMLAIAAAAQAQDWSTEEIFARYKASIVQVRIIDGQGG